MSSPRVRRRKYRRGSAASDEMALLGNNTASIATNKQVESAVNIADGTTIGIIFPMLMGFIAEVAHYALFPVAGALSLIRAGLVWRQVKLEQGQQNLKQGQKNETKAKAVLETWTGLAISFAVACSVAISAGVTAAAIAAVAAVAPFIFTVALAVKSVYSLGAACYYAYKAYHEKDEDKRNEYKQAAIGNMISFVVGSMITVAVGFVFLAAQPVWALLGFAGAAFGVGAGTFALISSFGKGSRGDGYSPVPGSPAESVDGEHIVSEDDVSPIVKSRKSRATHDVHATLSRPPSSPSLASSTLGVGASLRDAQGREKAAVATTRPGVRYQVREAATTSGFTRSDSGPLTDAVASTVAASASVPIPTAPQPAAGRSSYVSHSLHSPPNPQAAARDDDKDKERPLTPGNSHEIYGLY